MVEAPSPKRKPILEELKRSLVKADLACSNVRVTGGDGVEQMPIRVKSKRKAKVWKPSPLRRVDRSVRKCAETHPKELWIPSRG